MNRRNRILAVVFLAFAGWLVFIVAKRSGRDTPQRDREAPDAGEVDVVVEPQDVPDFVDAYVRVTPNRRAELETARVARRAEVVHATYGTGVRHGLCNVPLAGVGRDEFSDRLREALDGCGEAKGIFLPRTLGLGIRRDDRTLLQLDDDALDPIFALGKPVVIESGGPAAWFEGEGPFTGEAEPGTDWPTRTELSETLARRAQRHPELSIVLVDWGYLDQAGLQAWVSAAHRYVITSGAAPEGADAVMRAHPDRFLFGTGLTLTPDAARRGPEGVPIANAEEAWTAALAELEPLLDEESRAQVLRANAQQVLGL